MSSESVEFPCIKCKRHCEKDVIECSVCLQWLHRECVPMDIKLMESWKETGLEFVCNKCVLAKDGSYNFKGALDR